MNSTPRLARLVIAVSLPALLAACAAFMTTTDGVSAGFGSTTDATGSTTPDSKSAEAKRSEALVRYRFESIRFEAARGGGENLDALAALLGEPDRVGFARWIQRNYQPLFTDLREPVELLGRIEAQRDRRG
jgi:hypothetical protein